jgi:UDP-glucose 4-epimerase
MTAPKPTTEQLIEHLRTQTMDQPVYSQVGQGDGRSTPELMEALAKEAGTWVEEVSDPRRSGWGVVLQARAAANRSG